MFALPRAAAAAAASAPVACAAALCASRSLASVSLASVCVRASLAVPLVRSSLWSQQAQRGVKVKLSDQVSKLPWKHIQVRELREQVEQSAGVFVLHALEVTRDTLPLRSKLTALGARVRRAKNTLVRRALEDTRFQCLMPILTGPTSLVFVSDAQAVVQVATLLTKDKRVVLFAGAYDGVVLDRTHCEQLASLPPREASIAAVVAALRGPAATLVHSINAPTSAVVRALRHRGDADGAAASSGGDAQAQAQAQATA